MVTREYIKGVRRTLTTHSGHTSPGGGTCLNASARALGSAPGRGSRVTRRKRLSKLIASRAASAVGTHETTLATARPTTGILVYSEAGTSAAASASPRVVEKRMLCAVPPVPSPWVGVRVWVGGTAKARARAGARANVRVGAAYPRGGRVHVAEEHTHEAT
eukprot:scaffold24999_cov63-Phaeocystis_antarctica.AAC.14